LLDGVADFTQEEEISCHKCEDKVLLFTNLHHAITTMYFRVTPTTDPSDEHFSNEIAAGDQNTINNLLELCDRLEHHTNTYWAHKIRSHHDRGVLQQQVDQLKEHQILVIADWKMKLQMLLYRESMVEFFGKRGIPFHGLMIIRKKTVREKNAELDVKNEGKKQVSDTDSLTDCTIEFVDVLIDNSPEDAHAVGSIFQGNDMHNKIYVLLTLLSIHSMLHQV
jgi:hypothetical protein